MWRRHDADAGNVTPAAELNSVLNGVPDARAVAALCNSVTVNHRHQRIETHMQGKAALSWSLRITVLTPQT